MPATTLANKPDTHPKQLQTDPLIIGQTSNYSELGQESELLPFGCAKANSRRFMRRYAAVLLTGGAVS